MISGKTPAHVSDELDLFFLLKRLLQNYCLFIALLLLLYKINNTTSYWILDKQRTTFLFQKFLFFILCTMYIRTTKVVPLKIKNNLFKIKAPLVILDIFFCVGTHLILFHQLYYENLYKFVWYCLK